MATIQLHPADREKYGAPDIIEIDVQAIGVRQRSAVEKATKRSLRWMFHQLEGVPELDENQQPIPVPKIDPKTGEQLVEDGQPVFTEKLTQDGEAVAMFVWMALWTNGIRPDWGTFDVREDLVIRAGRPDDADEAEDPGKDDEPPTNSESTTTS